MSNTKILEVILRGLPNPLPASPLLCLRDHPGHFLSLAGPAEKSGG